jgi:hypothetical protein
MQWREFIAVLGARWGLGHSLVRLKLWLIVYLHERDAEPILFAPYDAAMPAHLIGLRDQREFVGNSDCIWNVKGGAGLRQVSDRATVRAAIEFDRRAFEDPTSNSPAIFIHARRRFLGNYGGKFLSGGY